MQQSSEIITKYSRTILIVFWKEYHVLAWDLNKQFTSFTVKEIKSYVENIPQTIDFLKENFQINDHCDNICKSLDLWHRICPFLTKSRITDPDKHEHEFDSFKNDIELFYFYGSKTFLTRNTVGDEETFYMHCLRFYMPQISQNNYVNHGVGVGVFTMQGLERRNKESKNTLRRFNAKKGNIAVPNLKRLWDIFCHGKTSV